MLELCNRYKLDFVFSNAVDGSLLDQGYMEQIYSGDESVKMVGRELSRNEIGCALSHMSIYRDIIEKNLEMSVVFEDDIIVDEDFPDILKNIDKIPENWDIVLFGHHPERSREEETCVRLFGRKKLNDRYCIARPGELACGAYAYLIKNSGARKMVELLKMIDMPVDHLTGSEKYLNVYVVHPAVIKIHDVYSDKLHNMSDRAMLQIKQISRTNPSQKDRIKFFLRRFKTYALLARFYKCVNYALCSVVIPKRYQ